MNRDQIGQYRGGIVSDGDDEEGEGVEGAGDEAAVEDRPQPPARLRRRGQSGERELAPFNPEDYYHRVVVRGQRKWAHGPVRETHYQIRLHEFLPIADQARGRIPAFQRQNRMAAILENAYGRMLDQMRPGTTAQLIASHPLLRSGIISSNRSHVPDLDKFTDSLSRAIQSEQRIGIQDVLFTLVTFRPSELQVRGQGLSSEMARRRLEHRYELDLEKWASIKKSLIDPFAGQKPSRLKYLEGKCLIAALAIQLHRLRNPRLTAVGLKQYRWSEKLIADVEYLTKELAMEGGDETCMKDLELLGPILALEDIGIALFSEASAPFLQVNPDAAKKALLFIVYSSEEEETGNEGDSCLHAYCISRLNAFFATKWACIRCYRAGAGHGPKKNHKCPKASCVLCHYDNCSNTSPIKELTPIICKIGCSSSFWSEECYKSHIPSCTFSRWICSICKISSPSEKVHKCGQYYCSNCSTTHSPLDLCYVSKGSPSYIGDARIFYGDMETKLELQHHKVNLIIIQNSSGDKQTMYYGRSAIRDFIQDLVKKNSPYINSFFLFHNGGG